MRVNSIFLKKTVLVSICALFVVAWAWSEITTTNNNNLATDVLFERADHGMLERALKPAVNHLSVSRHSLCGRTYFSGPDDLSDSFPAERNLFYRIGFPDVFSDLP